MAGGRFPLTVAARVNDREMARVDAASRLRGVVRAEYVRLVVLEATERDLRAAIETSDGPRARQS